MSSPVLTARAGNRFRADVVYWETDARLAHMDTTGFTASLQVRASTGNRRVVISTVSSLDDSALLYQPTADDGFWTIQLPGDVTSALPPECDLEVELTNDLAEDDRITLFAGKLLTNPELVSSTPIP
jgi:hypothetical protein